MRVSLSDEAQADANAAVDWYTGEGAFIAADDFADEIDQALSILSQFPELGKTGTRNTRTLALHSFPYSLIYQPLTDTSRYRPPTCLSVRLPLTSRTVPG